MIISTFRFLMYDENQKYGPTMERMGSWLHAFTGMNLLNLRRQRNSKISAGGYGLNFSEAFSIEVLKPKFILVSLGWGGSLCVHSFPPLFNLLVYVTRTFLPSSHKEVLSVRGNVSIEANQD
ncbi:hypothetical protein L6452_28579 [Arctium lappa]|uniref:Uncharacterized protein n=1 Tax=Arctium lappa TaxID=4217 RepID=A0ACB8ZY89_ARCLA|nr:hypothetical protein L6452_28579 [Arctium lappa]